MKFAKLIGLSYKRNFNSSHEVIVKQKRTFEKKTGSLIHLKKHKQKEQEAKSGLRAGLSG